MKCDGKSCRVIMSTLAAAFAASVATALAGGVDSAKPNAADEIKALREIIASNSVTRSTRCHYYKAYYRYLCTKEEREAILERNIAAHRRWIELAGKNGADPKGAAFPRAELGKVLVLGGRWDEAERELTEALKYDFDKASVAKARWALADCLWHRRDTDGAKKTIAEIAAMEFSHGAPFEVGKSRFLHRAWTDPDSDIDVFKLPHSVDGKPFPTPQEARYGEKKVSLEEIELKTAGIKPDDPIARLLKRKLSRFGSKLEKGGTKIEIAISPSAPIDKPQGYSLDISKGTVVIKARDRLGATWGAVSLIQCVDRDALAVRECSIRDWPKLERRGTLAYWDGNYFEYALFNKMSSVAMKMNFDGWPLLFSSLERERCRIMVKRFKDFGISLCWNERNLSVLPALPFTSPRTKAMHLSWMRCAAAVGAEVLFELDDERFFDFPEEDKKIAGSAANLDAKYMTSLYREVKKDYPDFHLTFGPPFYFGPDGGYRKDWYPEPRDPYLKSIGEFLDPEIDVYWTGPRVKSGGFTVEKISWYAKLIGRTQTVYHNSDCVGRHNWVRYGADIPAFKKSHCPETLDMIAGFYENTSRYEEACMVGPAMDWCWNPDAHDDAESCRRTIEQLEGPGVFEIIAEATPSLSYFDRYSYGQARGELLAEDPDDLDRRVKDAEKAWEAAKALGKNHAAFVRGFNAQGIYWARRLARNRRNPPKWLVEKRDAEMANTKFAVDEVGFDGSKGDQFIPASLMQGGTYNPADHVYTEKHSRGVKYVDAGKELAMDFACNLFPPESPPKLTIVGASFSAKVNPLIEVEVNGQSVWRGEAFIPFRYKPHEIELPVNAIRRSNRLVIRNIAQAGNWERKPKIHYAVIKMR